MKPDDVKAALPILLAFASGKKIEYTLDKGKSWTEIDSITPNMVSHDPDHYRIKPEPRVFYGIEWADGVVVTYPSEEHRDKILSMNSPRNKAITLLEQLP